jgi:hypothetical protein
MNILPLFTLPPVTLDSLQRLRLWHVQKRREKPREFQVFNAVLTVWMMGWVGWLPALVLSAWWALPLCAVAGVAPALYVQGRRRAHAAGRLRCDWLGLLA